MLRLPVDDLLPQIIDSLSQNPNLVLEAPPGAGKTTRVPPALLDHVPGEILVLEPRRLAARMAARRVSLELGENLGERAGYQVRFEEVCGPRTRLKFVTEGILTRRFLDDPKLNGVGAVILDEFHERHLDTDLALALLRHLQQERPDLRIVVMSATLDGAPIAAFLNCPVLRSEGRIFELAIDYTPHSALPLEQQVVQGVEKLIAADWAGDILVFLPGASEIRRAERELAAPARQRNCLIVMLHGDLTPAEQDRAVEPAAHRKIILSTNVAESSITIEGVTAVIDSGLARVAMDSPWTGLPAIEIRRISQASARQRAGRAGRTGPGRVIRLYTAEEFHRSPQAEKPEILRRELSGLALHLRGMRAPSLEWLDTPPQAAWKAAQDLLDRLHVSGEMAGLPLPPRLAKLVSEASARGVGERGCAVAALLSAGQRGSNDLFTLLDGEWSRETQRSYDQLRRLASPSRKQKNLSHADSERALLQGVLAAFPDRVARHRGGGALLLSQGGSARLPGCHHEFVVALDLEQRSEQGSSPLVRIAAGPIDPGWLLESATPRETLEWNRSAERVEQVSAWVYGQLVIDETRVPAKPSPETAAVLLERTRDVDTGRFVDRDELAQLEARARFAGAGVDFAKALEQVCQQCISFAELAQAKILDYMPPPGLDQRAPTKVKLHKGREVTVHYEHGKPPWIESRLQDFFGMKETPKVNGVAVVVHLLAPNRRPVQVTSDLSGFWERLYPQVRRELMRRYPKHVWPERPV